MKSSSYQTKPIGCVCMHSIGAYEFLQFMCGWELHRFFTTAIYIYFKIHQNVTVLINPRQTYYRTCEFMNSPLRKASSCFAGRPWWSKVVQLSSVRILLSMHQTLIWGRTDQLIGWLMFSPRKERIPAQMHHFITCWTEILKRRDPFVW